MFLCQISYIFEIPNVFFYIDIAKFAPSVFRQWIGGSMVLNFVGYLLVSSIS